jgi:hypothetical protein
MPQDLLPRRFQADLDRFYKQVILATLSELRSHENVKVGEFNSMDEFFDNAEKHTFNLVAYEARRCFALTLAAIFERQLRIWARKHFSETEKAGVSGMKFNNLLRKTAGIHALNLESAEVRKTIIELHLLGNAVRHGDGDSLDKLWKQTPHLWPHSTEAAAMKSKEQSLLSEEIRISDNNFVCYIRALTRFWGLADHAAGAVIDPPY